MKTAARRFCSLRVAGLILFLGAAVLLSCKRAKDRAPYPHESVLSILTELKNGMRADPYRDEPGRDLEGRNIHRVTLERLDNLNDLLSKSKPGEYDDILAFARAECLERLGDWSGAAASFAKCAAAGTTLAGEANGRKEWSGKISEAVGLTTGTLTLEGHLNTLDLRRLNLRRLLDAAPPFPYASFLSANLEETLRRKALFLFSNRYVLPGGAQDAVKAAQTLLEENKPSFRRGENLLLLGEFLETLARDYERLNDPSQSKFDLESWSRWVDGARGAYREAAQADGDPAKPEAQSRLRALDAYAQRISERAR